MPDRKRASLYACLAAVLGVFALAAPAAAGGAGPSLGAHVDPLPPPPIPPDELEVIVAELNAALAERDVANPGEEPAARTFSVPNPAANLVPPDPTDFDDIRADPADYGIPASAERFATGAGYAIPRPAVGGEATGAVPTGLAEFYGQDLAWEPCTDFGGPRGTAEDDQAAKEFECAYVIAPLDYSNPEGQTIALAVSRIQATGGEPAGTVLVNPGGPGSPGIDLAGAEFFTDLNEDFTIAGFDPRGVGASLPMIRCQSNDAWDRQRQGSDELTGEEMGAVLKYNTGECYENTGGIFGVEDFVGHVGTVNVAQDLDLIRSVLGDPKLNYIGFSYGTSIGYEYARQFPDNIRALVIDGVVDVLENNPAEKATYEEFQVGGAENGTIAQIAGFHATFEQFLTWCAGLEEDCALYEEDGENEVADLLARYQRLARAAWGGQTYGTEDGRPLSFEDFNQAAIMAMYSSSLWEALNAGLSEIQTAPTEDYFLMTLSDIYAGREEDGTYSLDLAAFPTIWCTDSGPEPGFNDDVEGQIQFIKDYYAAAPFTDPRTEDDPERGLEPSLDWCTYYAENFTLPTAVTLRAMPNVLAISTTYDSATPFDQGVVAAAAIGGTLLIAAGNDHTSYGSIECVTDITNEYFRTLRVRADIPGTEGVTTKDVHSNLITGSECTVTDEFRPVTALASGEGEPGDTLTLDAEGLVRNSEYVVDWQHGSLPLTATIEGEGTVELAIPADAEAGNYDLVLAPGIAGENDPAVRAEATLRILAAQDPEPGPTATPTDTPGPGDRDPEDSGDGAATDPADDTDAGDRGDHDTGVVTDPDLSTTGVRIGTIAAIAVAVIALGGAAYLISRRNGAK